MFPKANTLPVITTVFSFLLFACADPPEASRVSGPDMLSSASTSVSGDPFYYAGSSKILLRADYSRLVVESEDPNIAAAATATLRSTGVAVVASTPLSTKNHHVLSVTGLGASTLPSALASLRANPRISFAQPAYELADGRGEVLLVNRVAVRFKPRNLSTSLRHRVG